MWQVTLRGGWRNELAEPMMRALGIPSLKTWNQTVPMWQYYHNYNWKVMTDCTHSRHPSQYQLWVWRLFETLAALRDRLPQTANSDI